VRKFVGTDGNFREEQFNVKVKQGKIGMQEKVKFEISVKQGEI
jgi:hypothetical protein